MIISFPPKEGELKTAISKLDIKPTSAILIRVSAESQPHEVMKLAQQLDRMGIEARGVLILAGDATIKEIPVEQMARMGCYHKSDLRPCPNCDWNGSPPAGELVPGFADLFQVVESDVELSPQEVLERAKEQKECRKLQLAKTTQSSTPEGSKPA